MSGASSSWTPGAGSSTSPDAGAAGAGVGAGAAGPAPGRPGRPAAVGRPRHRPGNPVLLTSPACPVRPGARRSRSPAHQDVGTRRRAGPSGRTDEIAGRSTRAGGRPWCPPAPPPRTPPPHGLPSDPPTLRPGGPGRVAEAGPDPDARSGYPVPGSLIDWFAEGAATLVEPFRTPGPDVPVWTWVLRTDQRLPTADAADRARPAPVGRGGRDGTPEPVPTGARAHRPGGRRSRRDGLGADALPLAAASPPPR